MIKVICFFLLWLSEVMSISTIIHKRKNVHMSYTINSIHDVKYNYESQLIYYVSNDEKVSFLFKLFDIHPTNGYLGYSELKLLQQLTHPNIQLTEGIYLYIINLLGGNMRYGLSIQHFNSSYNQHKNSMGSNLDEDYAKIKNLINERQY